RVGDGVVDREELQVEGAEALPMPFFDLDRGRLDAVLAQLGGQERQCEPGTDERDVGALTQQERHTADVVLVPMGEHDRLDVVESVPDVVEVRQDQVDAGLFLLGEEHTAVDDEQPAVVLEDGHVATDLAKTAQGDHAQGRLPQGWWRGQSGMRVAHTAPSARRSTWTALAGTAWCGARPMGPLTPAAARSSRRSACSSEEASANGVRTGPEGRPNRFSTALTVMTPWVRKIPVYTGVSLRCMANAWATSPASKSSILYMRSLLTMGPTTLTLHAPPTDSIGRLRMSVQQ